VPYGARCIVLQIFLQTIYVCKIDVKKCKKRKKFQFNLLYVLM
jgi:hypothetical protein